jgi:hypothetical protein
MLLALIQRPLGGHLVLFALPLLSTAPLFAQYLYTLSVPDQEKADKLKQSLPPGASPTAGACLLRGPACVACGRDSSLCPPPPPCLSPQG